MEILAISNQSTKCTTFPKEVCLLTEEAFALSVHVCALFIQQYVTFLYMFTSDFCLLQSYQKYFLVLSLLTLAVNSI